MFTLMSLILCMKYSIESVCVAVGGHAYCIERELGLSGIRPPLCSELICKSTAVCCVCKCLHTCSYIFTESLICLAALTLILLVVTFLSVSYFCSRPEELLKGVKLKSCLLLMVLRCV